MRAHVSSVTNNLLTQSVLVGGAEGALHTQSEKLFSCILLV